MGWRTRLPVTNVARRSRPRAAEYRSPWHPDISKSSCDRALVIIISVFCLTAAGCNSLPAGDSAALQALHRTSATQPATPIVLIRGWRDLWSDGIDTLAEKLRANGQVAAVFKESQWRQVETTLVERATAAPPRSPIILVGFSYGADDAIRISRRLDGIDQSVDLLILVDPVTPASIPPNVRRCVNYFQSNGVWDVFPWLRGIGVTAEKPSLAAAVVNIDLRDRPDLLEPGTSHKTIAANAKVHAAILAEVERIGGSYCLP